MNGIAPKTIITDQDRVMKNAIAIVFPTTRHRFCLWHILKKVPEKLGSYGSYKTGMKSALMKYVYDNQSVEEFETSWDQLITTYNLHENAWLQSLYAEREHWVSAFLKDYFWAGMSTMQRSESMNAFFDESPIEKRFQELYTNSKFKEVQQQVTGMIDMNPKLHKSDGAVKTYLVKDEVHLEEFTKLVTYSVDFSEEDSSAKYEGDAPILNTQRSLFGHSEMDMANAGHVQLCKSITFQFNSIPEFAFHSLFLYVSICMLYQIISTSVN
ncbi:hypothetical protein LWI29_014183 [Acer saccharum]|uniref:Protein FAR1-RELATED SEQUENCE n=1 Tax=Acer saccharum TaxID=4024 RepID=A0AA39RD00_ACESA|nr:hypothetical protein LWI29_014183 [Acer saccharum]